MFLMKGHHHHQAQMTTPHLFMCPISLDLFTDPVTLCTGQTYDRPSIEKWLAAGNLTCPVTMQKLHDLSIVPNHTLRHLIDQWRQIGPQLDPDHLATIEYLAALKHNLESHHAPLETKIRFLDRLRALINGSPSRSSCLVQLGFVPSLLNLVFLEDNVEVVERALACALELLPLGEKGCLNMLQEEPKLSSFLVLFSNGPNTIKTGLCSLVEAISSSPETIQLCAMLGEIKSLLRELVILLDHNSEATNPSVKAISALCSVETNRESLVKAGAVNGLITYISNSNTEKNIKCLAPIAVSTIEQLLVVEGAKETLIENPNGIYALVKMVFKVSDHEGSESAVSTLTTICYDSLEAREEAISGGVLTQLLLLLQSQCNGRTKTKARMLLKLLKSKWAEDNKNVCRYK